MEAILTLPFLGVGIKLLSATEVLPQPQQNVPQRPFQLQVWSLKQWRRLIWVHVLSMWQVPWYGESIRYWEIIQGGEKKEKEKEEEEQGEEGGMRKRRKESNPVQGAWVSLSSLECCPHLAQLCTPSSEAPSTRKSSVKLLITALFPDFP